MDNLLQKAQNNMETAKLAEEHEFYDAAVSRYYYCLYEKIIYLLDKKGLNKEGQGKNSHQKTIDRLTNNIGEFSSNNGDFALLKSMQEFRKKRNDSDYRNKIIKTKDEFELSCKSYFLKINTLLDKFISSIQERG